MQTYYLQRMKTSLGQVSIKYSGPNIWSDIPENLKFNRLIHLERNIKTLYHVARISVDLRCTCLSHSAILFFMPLFLHSITHYTCSPHPICVGMLSPHRSLFAAFLNYFTWHWFDDFITYWLIVKHPQLNLVSTSHKACWELDPGGLSPTLGDSTRYDTNIKQWHLKILTYLYFHPHENNLKSFMVWHSFYFPIWVTKIHK